MPALELSNPSETWSSERPVEMVRVMVDTADIQSRVDGWPAAFWMRSVKVRCCSRRSERPDGSRGMRRAKPSAIGRRRFFVKRLDPPQHTEQLTNYLSQEIGYQIPDRGVIAAILGGNMLAILARGHLVGKATGIALHGVSGAGRGIARPRSSGCRWATEDVGGPIDDRLGANRAGRTRRSSQESASNRSLQSTARRRGRCPSNRAAASDHVDCLKTKPRRKQDESVWNDSGNPNGCLSSNRQNKVTHATTNAVVTLPAAWSVRGRFTPEGFQGRVGGSIPAMCRTRCLSSAANPIMPSSSTRVRSFESGSSEVCYQTSSLTNADVRLAAGSSSPVRQLHDVDSAFFPKAAFAFLLDRPGRCRSRFR